MTSKILLFVLVLCASVLAQAGKDSSALSAPADSSRKGGLLGSLHPIGKDESISKGHLQGGATLSLIQAETDDDALDVIIGEIYEAEGYSFTVEAFGGYFIKDALALGLRAGYSRTWYDIDFSLMEDLVDFCILVNAEVLYQSAFILISRKVVVFIVPDKRPRAHMVKSSAVPGNLLASRRPLEIIEGYCAV